MTPEVSVGVVDGPASESTPDASGLPTLAVNIVAAHRSVVDAESSALLYAKQAGDLLIQAKAQVRAELGPCQWLKWLGANCDFAPRTAQDYMRIAREWPRLEEEQNARPAAHFDITRALLFLTGRSELLHDLDDDEDDTGDEDQDDDADDDDDDDDGDDDSDGCGGNGAGGTGGGSGADAQPKTSRLAFTVATFREFWQMVATFADDFGITASDKVGRLLGVMRALYALRPAIRAAFAQAQKDQ